MYLIYFDESGNTGNNLNDSQQPIYVLCALIVPESKWLQVERDLHAKIENLLPSPLPDDFEVHATDLQSGRRWFKDISLTNRLAFRNAWFSIAVKYDLKLVYRGIEKKRFERWIRNKFGSGIAINPHVAAFALVARVVNDYLKSLPDSPLGILISDENKEIVRDVEKSIKILRGIEGTLKLGQVIEKGFFIDSTKSIILQLCDLCAYSLRKREEEKITLGVNPLHQSGIKLLEPLIYQGDEAFQDVIEWFSTEEKKKRPGTMS
ncbi:MAG: DUF3800 domain-containing protein [Thermoguttaceae bacterium]|jgi:hypothetical protein